MSMRSFMPLKAGNVSMKVSKDIVPSAQLAWLITVGAASVWWTNCDCLAVSTSQ